MRINFTQITMIVLILGSTALKSSATDFNPLENVNPAAIDANNSANLMRAIKEHNLSQDAQNITVTSQNGATVLRGVVKDDRERLTISSLAAQCGCNNIRNELSVKSAPVVRKSTQAKKPLVIYRKTH